MERLPSSFMSACASPGLRQPHGTLGRNGQVASWLCPGMDCGSCRLHQFTLPNPRPLPLLAPWQSRGASASQSSPEWKLVLGAHGLLWIARPFHDCILFCRKEAIKKLPCMARPFDHWILLRRKEAGKRKKKTLEPRPRLQLFGHVLGAALQHVEGLQPVLG